MKPLISFLIFFLSLTTSLSQVILPESGVVFNDKVVPRIYIKIHPDSLAELLSFDNLDSNHEYPVDFVWFDGQNKDTITNVGFRLRGNTSRMAAKKSFKIQFDKFDDHSFYGLDELNINGEHNDPTIMRSKLCWDLMKMAGVESTRSNHVSLYINNVFFGIYINVEHIDKIYLKTRKKDPDGQLFKCNYGVNLVYNGENPNSYSKDVYEPVNNADNPDYASFINFLKVLNSPSDPEYRCKLEAVFDVDDYLKRLAIEILTGHWDNPVYNINNAYLYHNPKTGKYQLISYDMDNTFGIDWFNVDWSKRNVYSWAKSGQKRPVYEIIKHVPEYKLRLGYYIEKYLKDFFNKPFLQTHVSKLFNQIAPLRSSDTYASLDYGYTFADFLFSYQSSTGKHVKNGLYEYIQLRNIAAVSQIGTPDPAPIIDNVYITENNQKAMLNFEVNGKHTSVVELFYSLNNGIWESQILSDDGSGYDLNAGDRVYNYVFDIPEKTNVNYYITAKDERNISSRLPVCNNYTTDIGFDSTPKLIINEFMADNSVIKDNAGELEDWIEIYNADNKTIWLGDKYLTDNPERPDKWKMPEISLESGSFLLFWADEDQDQGDLHTNFKLSKSGEFIGIFDNEANNFAPIDTFHFHTALTNISYGRYPDGQGNIVTLSAPTPGISNVLSLTENVSESNILVYPNPSSSKTTVFNLRVSDKLTIYKDTGNFILHTSITEDKPWNLDTENWKSGVYFILIERNGVFSYVKYIKY
jgi:spore coat protein H